MDLCYNGQSRKCVMKFMNEILGIWVKFEYKASIVVGTEKLVPINLKFIWKGKVLSVLHNTE